MQLMTRNRWGTDLTPWQELESLNERMRRMMGTPITSQLLLEPTEWMPPVALVEEDGEYLLTAELPGMEKKDVDVSVEDNVLTLKGEKKTERKTDEGRRHIQERSFGAFERSFTIPRNVKVEAIEAEFHDGLVEVHLPKTQETKGRHIEVKGT